VRISIIAEEARGNGIKGDFSNCTNFIGGHEEGVNMEGRKKGTDGKW